MNALNSLIIEGKIISEPKVSMKPNGCEVTCFALSHSRFCKGIDGNTFEERNIFNVETLFKSSAIKINKGVRLVGRLRAEKDGKVCIVVEHLEIKA